MFDVLLIELPQYCPLQKYRFPDILLLTCDIDLTFVIWICLDSIQIKFDFYCVWPNCTADIFFCLNFVYHTFICRLGRYGHQIWGLNLNWHNTEKVSLFYPFIYSFGSYASLKFVGAGRGHALFQQYLQYACW